MVLIGFFFFVNPIFGYIDILPDIIGCVLIFFGLTRLAYLDGKIEAARKTVFWLFVSQAAKLLFTPSVLRTYISSNRLLAVTAAVLIESFIFVVFIRNFFAGTEYFATRNGYIKCLKRISGTRFLTYAFFFTRQAATFLPELYSMIELKISGNQYDFDKVDTMRNLLGTKPVVTVFLALAEIIMGIAFYISFVKTYKAFGNEASDTIEERYCKEYKKVPTAVNARKLRIGTILFCFSLFFAADFMFDGMKIIPAYAMFPLLFLSSFVLKGIAPFSNTKKFALPAFAIFLITEIYRYNYVVPDPVVIIETPLSTVIISSVFALACAFSGLIFVRGFFNDLDNMSLRLVGKGISTGAEWTVYCILTCLRSLMLVLPYTSKWLTIPSVILACVFIYLSAKTVICIRDAEEEHRALYGE